MLGTVVELLVNNIWSVVGLAALIAIAQTAMENRYGLGRDKQIKKLSRRMAALEFELAKYGKRPLA